MNFLVRAGHVNEDELQFDDVLFANSQKIKTPWKASFYHFLSKKKKTRLFLLKEVKPITLRVISIEFLRIISML